MPKLTQQQVQFIYNYLENSGVEYLDARVEMTDHVASALESLDGDFSENFKAYMADNKQSLLEQNTTFRKQAQTRAYNLLGKKLLHPAVLVVMAVLTAGILVLPQYMTLTRVTDIYVTAYGVMAMLLFVFVIYFRVFSKNIYSVIGQLIYISVLFGCLLNSWRIIKNEYALVIFYSAGICIILAMAASFYSMHKFYTARFTNNYEKA
jgi:hypothetical protein